MSTFCLKQLQQLYENDGNIIDFLKKSSGCELNTPEIIKIAYDFQSGSYIKFAEENTSHLIDFLKWAANIIRDYAPTFKSILDAGSGELTTLYYFLNSLKKLELCPQNVFAFDISWSRIFCGKQWLMSRPEKFNLINLFCANLLELPLLRKSMDLVVTFHALEPNGGNEKSIIQELFRVCKKALIMFEPSYELNSVEGKSRMDQLGYIKNIPAVIEELGGMLCTTVLYPNPINPLNPTAAYVVTPPSLSENTDTEQEIFPLENSNQTLFTDPGGNTRLENQSDSYYSPATGLSYPVISGIPIFIKENSILTTYKSKM